MAQKLIYRLPRILSILFIIFLSIFAFDVFEEYSGWELLLALFMHLLPSLVLFVLTLIAWKHELVGGVTYLLAAIGYVLMVGLDRPWSWYVLISGPAAIIGILYFVSWYKKDNPSA